MRVNGLPIGRGEVWHDHPQRFLAIALAFVSLLPLATWLVAGLGWVPLAHFNGWVEGPCIALTFGLGLFATICRRALAQRVGAGLLAGLVGALVYLVVIASAKMVVAGIELPLSAAARTPGASLLLHMATTVPLWALAFAVIVGKARWYFGAIWLVAIWVVIAFMAELLPLGSTIILVNTPVLLSLLACHIFAGTVIGIVNEVVQPDIRGAGKIIFIQDYERRIKPI